MDTAQENPNHGWIKKLADSKFNYWFGYVANIIIVSLLIRQAVLSPTESFPALKVLALAAGGYIFYTFTEYVFHRWLYHIVTSPFSTGHGLHHDYPKALMGLPWYFPVPAIFGAYYLLAYHVFHAPGAVGIFMGAWWAGFICYCAVHHSTHHFNFKNKWFRKVKAHHRIHHVREETNYGVLTTFWDKVFQTEFKKEDSSEDTKASY